MTLIQITAPTVTPISLLEARRHLKIDSAAENENLEAYIAAVSANLDGRDGWLGRSLTEQTWELRIDCFQSKIKIPLPPLKSITSVKYTDTSGTTQTVSASVYRVTGGGFGPSFVELAYGQVWPTPRGDTESVQVRFVCGYGSSGVEPLPAPIKAALLLMVGGLHKGKESWSREEAKANPALLALLQPYWVAGF